MSKGQNGLSLSKILQLPRDLRISTSATWSLFDHTFPSSYLSPLATVSSTVHRIHMRKIIVQNQHQQFVGSKSTHRWKDFCRSPMNRYSRRRARESRGTRLEHTEPRRRTETYRWSVGPRKDLPEEEQIRFSAGKERRQRPATGTVYYYRRRVSTVKISDRQRLSVAGVRPLGRHRSRKRSSDWLAGRVPNGGGETITRLDVVLRSEVPTGRDSTRKGRVEPPREIRESKTD